MIWTLKGKERAFIALISSLGFVTKPVLLTYGVSDTACGVSGLGALPRMDFVLIMHSETKRSSIAFQLLDAKSITNRA